MESEVAVRLIRNGVPGEKIQTWIDLGAGSGLFTNALSQLLPLGSSILAVDKKLSNITLAEGIRLETKTGDFTAIDLGKSDGVLMANSLHYVGDQRGFLKKLSNVTKRLVLVEYDTDKSNPWVPYPVNFDKLSLLVNASKIGEAPSQYEKQGMYAALILF